MDIEYTTKYGVSGKVMGVLSMNSLMKMMMDMFRKLDRTLRAAEGRKVSHSPKSFT